MSAFKWKTDPTENGQIDAAVPALPGTSARLLPDAARGIMAGVAMLDATVVLVRSVAEEA